MYYFSAFKKQLFVQIPKLQDLVDSQYCYSCAVCILLLPHAGYRGKSRPAEGVAYGIVFWWIGLVLSTSDIRATIFGRLMMISFAVFILGALFVIQHWEGGYIIQLAGVCCIMVCYVARFVNKKNKTTLDVLKLLLVVVFCCVHYLREVHWIAAEWSNAVPVVFLVMIIEFARQYDGMRLRMLKQKIQL